MLVTAEVWGVLESLRQLVSNATGSGMGLVRVEPLVVVLTGCVLVSCGVGGRARGVHRKRKKRGSVGPRNRRGLGCSPTGWPCIDRASPNPMLMALPARVPLPQGERGCLTDRISTSDIYLAG